MKWTIMVSLLVVLVSREKILALDPTIMFNPSNNSLSVPMQPTFTWSNSNGASKYKVQICTDAGMNTIYTELMDISNTLTSVTLGPSSAWSNGKIALAAMTKYWWRVVAYDYANATFPSTAYAFQTSTFGPVTLSSPSNNATNVAVQPNFTWQTNGATSQYKLQVCSDQYMTQLVVDQKPVNTPYQMNKSTTPNTVLEIGENYWWRVVGYDGSGNISTSAANKITIVTPSNPYYPIQNQDMISCAFGPRHVTGTNWFHGAIDIANSPNSATADVVAPCNCKVVAITYLETGQADCVDFVNTESNGVPKSFRIQHVKIPSGMSVSSTYKRGQVIFTELEQYYGSGYHVHTNAWDVVLTAYGSEKGNAVNPLKYWQHSDQFWTQSQVGPASNGTWPTDANEGNYRYFYFTVIVPRTDFTLNKIVVQVMGTNNTDITSNFLLNPNASTLNFTEGLSINKSATGVTDTWDGTYGTANNDATTVSVPLAGTGVKILCPDLTTSSNKVYLFRYYIKSDAPNPANFQASVYDFNNSLRENITSSLPLTPVGQYPPDAVTSITVSQITNGLKIDWVKPASGEPADFWAIYRKVAGSTESPLLIGITSLVPGTNSGTFQDRTNIVTNTIVPGTTYSYTVAGRNKYGEGNYGTWVNGTMTALPTDFVFQNRNISITEPDLKAKNSITINTVNVSSTGVKKFTAGNIIKLTTPVQVDRGAKINLTIDPALR